MLMPIGHYRGREVNTLPTDYIGWAIANLPIRDPELLAELNREFQARQGVHPFENARGDPHAPERREEVRVDEDMLHQAWAFYQARFEKVIGFRLPSPASLGFRCNSKILGTWYPGLRRLSISNYWILPRKTFFTVLVHEMCHQAVTDMGLPDDKPHGSAWQEIARKMSEDTGFDIQRTTPPKGFIANPSRRSEPHIIRIYKDKPHKKNE